MSDAAAALTWADAALAGAGLARTGPAELVQERPWGRVWRLPTSGGPCWLKAPAPALRHEVALHLALAERRPGLVPALLAADPDAGRLLLRDAGRRLREVVAEERSLERWLAVLPRYAELQLATAPEVERLVALGLPDLRPGRLVARYVALLDALEALGPAWPASVAERARFRSATAAVEADAALLAASGIPATVDHGDLHDGQVHLAPDGSPRILDWGDATVAHPFVSMAVTLVGCLAWGLDDVAGSVDPAPYRDAYLAPFAAVSGRSLAMLRETCLVAERVGWATRAIGGWLGDGDPARTLVRLRMLVSGRPDPL